MAMCTRTDPIPEAPAAEEERGDSLTLPLVLGIGSVVVVAGVVLYMRKR
jgi:hypothetical protein